MKRLNRELLQASSAGVSIPRYDPQRTSIGIVHLGLGNFHRAHQAVYADRLLARDARWAISGVHMTSAKLQTPMQQQDHLYTVVEQDANASRAQIVGSIREVLSAQRDTQSLLERLVDRNTRLFTLTITEKGYGLHSATEDLDPDHPSIARDLQQPHAPTSAVGLIAKALHERFQGHRVPPTVLSCDNYSGNGEILRRLTVSFARMVFPQSADWIAESVAFPSSMVDRIVPAPSPETIDRLQHLTGYRDDIPLLTEPFSQWVIENHFSGERPSWDEDGVQFVSDVAPYELMKLRLLNGSHSVLAYVGYLLGFPFIYQASQDQDVRLLVKRMMQHTFAPTLLPVEGVNLSQYQQQLLERFDNPALGHTTAQVANDGSKKIPQRWLPALDWHQKHGRVPEELLFGLAAWIRFLYGRDESGQRIHVDDPLEQDFARRRQQSGNLAEFGHAVLAMREIFPAEFVTHEGLRNGVLRHLNRIECHGIRAALQHTLQSPAYQA